MSLRILDKEVWRCKKNYEQVNSSREALTYFEPGGEWSE
jgi:hypothetical protein